MSTHPDLALLELADGLHSAAIHMLRRVRSEDQALGLTASRLSAMSVVVFAGPVRLTDLAAAEQVRLPTMTRLVKELESEGLLERSPDPDDARAQQIRATAKGRRLLQQGRERRVRALAERLAALSRRDQDVLRRAAGILDRLVLPTEHPRRG